MKVATVIMHYQRNDLTDQVLLQLGGIEDVFVFDDGSTPALGRVGGDYWTPADIEHGYDLTYRGAKVLGNWENTGYVIAVNRAMSALNFLGYDAVWCLNNDVHGLSAELLQAMIRAFNADSKLAAASPALTPTAHVEMKPGNQRFKGEARNSFGVRRAKFIDWVCPLVRMKAWLQVGGFDENLKGFGCDLQFTYDARRVGWKFAVLPKFIVEHDMGATRRSVGNTDHADIAFMRAYLCSKYGVKRWEDLKK